MINKLRKDYMGVREAIKFLTGNKAPEWAMVIYYILMLPIGLLLYPIVKIWNWIILRRIMGGAYK